MSDARTRVFGALVGSGGSEIFNRVATVALSIVVARALEPSQVGVLGFAVVFYSILLAVGAYIETGAVTVDSSRSHIETATASMLLRLAFGVVSITAVSLAMPLIAPAFAADSSTQGDLASVMPILLAATAVDALGAFPRVLLQRALSFRWIIIGSIAQTVTYVALTILLLSREHSPASIAWASFGGAVVTVATVWIGVVLGGTAGWPVVPGREAVSTVLKKTRNIFVGGFPGFFTLYFDNLLVSFNGGPAMLSFYSLAWNASRVPVFVISRAFLTTLIPAFARIQDSNEKLQTAVRDCLYYSYLLAAPAAAAIIVAAPDIVLVVLGEKWMPVAPCLRVLSLSILAAPFLFVVQALLTGTGGAHWTGIPAVAMLCLQAIVIPVAVGAFGLIGAAVGDLIVVVVTCLVVYAVVARVMSDIQVPLLRAAAAPTAAAAIAGFVAVSAVWGMEPGFARAALGLLLVTVVYAVLVPLVGGLVAVRGLLTLVRGVLPSR